MNSEIISNFTHESCKKRISRRIVINIIFCYELRRVVIFEQILHISRVNLIITLSCILSTIPWLCLESIGFVIQG